MTHQVLSGEIRFYTISLDVDQWAPVDPYQAPEKRVADLRLFDLHASRLKRVKVSGEIIHGRKDEYFMMDGMDGIRILLEKVRRSLARETPWKWWAFRNWRVPPP